MKWSVDVMAYYLLEAGMPEHEAITAVACAWTITEGDDAYYVSSRGGYADARVGIYAITSTSRSSHGDDGSSQMQRDAKALIAMLRMMEVSATEYYGNLAAVPGYVFYAARIGVANPIAGYEPGKAPANFGINTPVAPFAGFVDLPFPGLE